MLKKYDVKRHTVVIKTELLLTMSIQYLHNINQARGENKEKWQINELQVDPYQILQSNIIRII